MLNKLKKLIVPCSPPKSVPEHRGTRSGRTSLAARHNRAALSVPREVDDAFYGHILGVQSSTGRELNAFEKKIIRQLNRLLAADVSHSSLVPRIPDVMPRVMRSLRDQDSSAADLAGNVGRDAVLVSEVIRLANSPYYRVGEKITSLERAIVILGRNGVRQLVVNAAFKPLINLNSGHFTGLSATTLWENSERAAIACDCMARQERADRFQAYLAGIVANVGFTVALKVLDHAFDGHDAPRSESFRHLFITRSRKLSLVIAAEWGFPEPVLEALDAQTGAPETAKMSSLARILFVSDKLAKLQILSEQGRFKKDMENMARRLKASLDDYPANCYPPLSA